MATFKEAIITCVQEKYVTFSGRASRSEFWYFSLFNFLSVFCASLLDYFIFGHSSGILYIITALGLFLPGLAVGFRRLHDTGRTAWWLLITLIPLVGFITLIVFYCQKSEAEMNKYGPPPAF